MLIWILLMNSEKRSPGSEWLFCSIMILDYLSNLWQTRCNLLTQNSTYFVYYARHMLFYICLNTVKCASGCATSGWNIKILNWCQFWLDPLKYFDWKFIKSTYEVFRIKCIYIKHLATHVLFCNTRTGPFLNICVNMLPDRTLNRHWRKIYLQHELSFCWSWDRSYPCVQGRPFVNT